MLLLYFMLLNRSLHSDFQQILLLFIINLFLMAVDKKNLQQIVYLCLALP